MAVYKTYQEAVKTNQSTKDVFTDGKWFFTDGSERKYYGVKACNPADYLVSLLSFHSSGRELSLGGSIVVNGSVLNLDREDDLATWNEGDEGDHSVFVLDTDLGQEGAPPSNVGVKLREYQEAVAPAPTNEYVLNLTRDIDKMIEDGQKTVRLRPEHVKQLLDEVMASRGISLPVYRHAEFDAPWEAAKAQAYGSIMYRKDGNDYKRVETEQEACSFWDGLYYE